MTDFMKSDLITWLKSLKDIENENDPGLTYPDIYNGIFLNELLLKIDSNASNSKQQQPVCPIVDAKDRFFNWENLVVGIRRFYTESLQQIILLPPANIMTISKEPESIRAQEEIEKVLLLLLGAAVQCEQREYFITAIMDRLTDQGVQGGIMASIQEITDENSGYIVSFGSPTNLVDTVLLNHLRQVCAQRDNVYLEESRAMFDQIQCLQSQVVQLQSQLDIDGVVGIGVGSNSSTAAAADVAADPKANIVPSSHHHHSLNHLQVELADNKAKIRRMRTELDEKEEYISELREELSECKRKEHQQQEELNQIQRELRQMRQLQDELDSAREKILHLQQAESELNRLKQKVAPQAEFYKKRCQELTEDLSIVSEDKLLLIQQLESETKRVEKMREIELESKTLHRRVSDLEEQLLQSRRRNEELEEDLSRLEWKHGLSLSTTANLAAELELSKVDQEINDDDAGEFDNNARLSESLVHSLQSKARKLELENRRLQQIIRDLTNQMNETKDNLAEEKLAFDNQKTFSQELQKEISRLQLKVKNLQENRSVELQSTTQLQQIKQNLQKENSELKLSLETTRLTLEQQMSELLNDKEELNQTIQILREREKSFHSQLVSEQEDDNDSVLVGVGVGAGAGGKIVIKKNLQDFERENNFLHEQCDKLRNELDNLRLNERHLRVEIAKLELGNSDKINLEKLFDNLREERDALKLQLLTFKRQDENYKELENSFHQLEMNHMQLQRVNEQNNIKLLQKQSMEEEILALKIENEQLKRVKESLCENSSSRMIHLEGQLTDLLQEKHLLERQLQQLNEKEKITNNATQKLDEKENQILRLTNDLEQYKMQLSIQEKLTNSLEEENNKINRDLEKYLFKQRQFDQIQNERNELENKQKLLQQEKDHLEKECKRLKTSLESKSQRMEEMEKHLELMEERLTKSNEDVNKLFEKRIYDLNEENRELYQQMKLEKKTQVSLREDLVKEKVLCQQLQNELNLLNSQLLNIGMTKDNLNLVQEDNLEKRYELLESILENTMKDRNSQKDKQLLGLQSRLNESTERNKQLSQELKQLIREHEALKQRYEEETTSSAAAFVQQEIQTSAAITSATPSSSASSLHSILQLKDRLVQLERENAKLESEKESLEDRSQALQERVQSHEQQNHQLQDHCMNLQKHNTDLLSHNARLQVDNSGLTTQLQQMKKDFNLLQTEHNRMMEEFNRYRELHSSMSADQSQLQQLHQKLTNDYEKLQEDYDKLKRQNRDLFLEFQDKVTELNEMTEEMESVKHLREALEKEKSEMKGDSQANVALQEKMHRLQSERDRIEQAREELSNRLKESQAELRERRRINQTVKAQHEQTLEELETVKSVCTRLNNQMTQLASQCEALTHINDMVSEENKSLMLQLQSLLNQNQDLLTQSLANKDHHHIEEVQLRERLMTLQRQKERLEEKIMEQYKRSPSPKKKRAGFGTDIVRRARELFDRKWSASRNNLGDSSHDEAASLTPSGSSKTLTSKQRSMSMFALGNAGSSSSPPQGQAAEIPLRGSTVSRIKRQAPRDSISSTIPSGPKDASGKSLENLTDDQMFTSNGGGPLSTGVNLRKSNKKSRAAVSGRVLVPGSVSVFDREPEEGNTTHLREFILSLDSHSPSVSSEFSSRLSRVSDEIPPQTHVNKFIKSNANVNVSNENSTPSGSSLRTSSSSSHRVYSNNNNSDEISTREVGRPPMQQMPLVPERTTSVNPPNKSLGDHPERNSSELWKHRRSTGVGGAVEPTMVVVGPARMNSIGSGNGNGRDRMSPLSITGFPESTSPLPITDRGEKRYSGGAPLSQSTASAVPRGPTAPPAIESASSQAIMQRLIKRSGGMRSSTPPSSSSIPSTEAFLQYPPPPPYGSQIGKSNNSPMRPSTAIDFISPPPGNRKYQPHHHHNDPTTRKPVGPPMAIGEEKRNSLLVGGDHQVPAIPQRLESAFVTVRGPTSAAASAGPTSATPLNQQQATRSTRSIPLNLPVPPPRSESHAVPLDTKKTFRN